MLKYKHHYIKQQDILIRYSYTNKTFYLHGVYYGKRCKALKIEVSNVELGK